jgi:hypothetical protein
LGIDAKTGETADAPPAAGPLLGPCGVEQAAVVKTTAPSAKAILKRLFVMLTSPCFTGAHQAPQVAS